jgi:hypothetical protein
MIWTLLQSGLVAILVACIRVPEFLRFVHISKGRLTGAETNEKCRKGSESFALMDEQGKMHLLSPGDAQMMKAQPQTL